MTNSNSSVSITDMTKNISDSLCKLTGLHLTALDTEGKMLFQSGKSDPVVSYLNTTEQGKQETQHFLKHAVRSTLSRYDVTILKGPSYQYYLFLPLTFNETKLIFSVGSFYSTIKDYDDFIHNGKEKYHITSEDTRNWQARIHIRDFHSIKATAESLQYILNELIAVRYENLEYEGQYNFVKTILDITSDLRSDMDISEIHRVMIDFPLLLMKLDTVSYSSFDEELHCLVTQVSSGIHSQMIKDMHFSITGIIEEAINSGTPQFSTDVYDILRLGLGEDIQTIAVFPIAYDKRAIGILNVYNSDLSPNQIEILNMFSKVTGYMIDTIQLKKRYEKNIGRISNLNEVTSIFDPTVKQEDLFYSIVNNAGNIAKANRASLMLLENDEVLQLKAAKGINRHVSPGIRVKVGESVAGKVIESKSPLMVRDITKELAEDTKVGSTYKTRSFISIPLTIKDKAIGVLNVADKITGTIFSNEDLQLLKSFASYATVVLESSNYYRLSEQMRELSITDSLTGIFNRRYFNERLEEEIQRSLRHDFSCALALADIDNFKAFNDAEGHLCGDSVLKAIANITKESVRATDILSRFGGEEFAIIFPQTDRAGAYHIAERIRKNIKRFCPRFWKSFPIEHITVSIGIAVLPENGKDSKELIKNTDRALYSAKIQGKDRTIVYYQ